MNVSFNVVGIDLYNQCLTGGVAKSLTNIATDADHIPCVLVYDARGNGGGAISPTITGDHQDRITDYTAIVVQNEVVQPGEQNRIRRIR